MKYGQEILLLVWNTNTKQSNDDNVTNILLKFSIPSVTTIMTYLFYSQGEPRTFTVWEHFPLKVLFQEPSTTNNKINKILMKKFIKTFVCES